MGEKKKLIRITTVPISLKVLLRNQLKFMSQEFEVLAVSSPGNILNDVSTHEGVRIAPVSMTRTISPAKDLKSVWQLYKLFKKEKPDIVHTHTPKAGLVGMLASKMAGVPIRIHTVAGMPLMETDGFKRKILEKVEKLTYKCATKVYPNSKNLAQFILQNKYCSEIKLNVLGNGSSNGIDTEYFKPTPELVSKSNQIKTELSIGEDDFIYVFIGRLVKDKGIEELVKAFTGLKKSQSKIKLLLVGPYEPELDPLSENIEKLIKEDNDIIQIDFQQDVRPYLLMSNVLTFPSYREGFPNVPMQAGCFDLPSIVTNINGCNEIIIDEQNGLIIPSKDAKALQSAMERLLTDFNLYKNIKAKARSLIVERYDQKKLWSLLLQEYQDQLKRNKVVS